MSNFWADKLGRVPQQQPQQQAQPVQAHAAPAVYPGSQAFQTYIPVVPQQPQYPQQQQQPTPQQLDPGQINAYKAQLREMLKNKQITPEQAAAEWARLGGGDGSRLENQSCPHCAGNRFFTRELLRTQGGQLRRASRKGSPAPICMDCGYVGEHHDMQYAETHDAPQG